MAADELQDDTVCCRGALDMRGAFLYTFLTIQPILEKSAWQIRGMTVEQTQDFYKEKQKMKRKHLIVLTLAWTMLLLGCMGSAMGGSVHFTNEGLPEAMVGVYYHTRVKVAGDDIPYAVTLTTNPDGRDEFPSELNIMADGVIYGTPKREGVFTFALQVAYDGDKTALCVAKLVINPFSQDALIKGGEDINIIGEGNDSLTGVANGINGGRVTMEPGMDTVYFTSAKHKLCAIDRPYTKAAELFPAPEYRWLDAIGSNLYYYHRYYQKPDWEDSVDAEGYYVTRVCRDPAGKKGRETLTELNVKEIMDLGVTDKIVLYIQGKGKGLIKRMPLKGGDAVSIRCYHDGKELQADSVFPYNGYAYLRNAENGCLYRVALDGQSAQKLTDEKASAYTVSRVNDEDFLFYAKKDGALFRVPLDGGEKEAFGKLKVSAINSDADSLYFANKSDKNRLYRVSSGSPDAPDKLTDFSVDQIYVFDGMLAVQKKGGTELYVLDKDAAEEPVRIGK